MTEFPGAQAARAEHERLSAANDGKAAWRRWGPYLAERAWGTVREDYSAGGTAWDYLPHDHARSRAYRWSEDGLAGICDDEQILCLALALWNGRDPILKERIFGLGGPEGNHGEDAKEYWFYLDSTPTHSWMRWRYLYPRRAFPYDDLVHENGRRGRDEPEFELLDTGVFDGGHWEVTVDVAKADPEDLVYRIRARNVGIGEDTIHILPTMWFRNTWAWGRSHGPRPVMSGTAGALVADHPHLGRRVLRSSGSPEALVCDNDTNMRRLYGIDGTAYPKDGINDHVVNGAPTVNPDRSGTKAALHHVLTVPAGETLEVLVRLAPDDRAPDVVSTELLVQREEEADGWFASVCPDNASTDEALVLRQAIAGMLWSKQFYNYDVANWLAGDPGQPAPPSSRLTGRNEAWWHLNAHDIISMPDSWEYPWFAAWDLAFHCVAIAHVDPQFAKEQLILLCREWYMHPNGQLPAYEWAFGDVNPPVHAWAAMRVFEIDGYRDYAFLERVFHKLLLNFTWWVNRKDAIGNNVFEGGFLGLDNIGPFDRSAELPVQGILEQSDGTAWMALYCLTLLEMSLSLAFHDRTYEDVATKFFEHFTYIARAMNQSGMWDDADGFYYDILRRPDGSATPLRARSIVGIIPLVAVATMAEDLLARLPDFDARMQWFVHHRPGYGGCVDYLDEPGEHHRRLLSIVTPDRLRRLLGYMLDEDEFLSPHGLRALSRYHRDHPLDVDLGGVRAHLDYEPAESTTGLFGGNSNWRGPVWFPVNHLVLGALLRYHRYFGDTMTVEHPTGSGVHLTLDAVSADIARRLVGTFLDDEHGRRPVFGPYERFQTDPDWHGLIPFHEYFHGDTGQGLGASHQTGWTGLVIDLICGGLGLASDTRGRSGADTGRSGATQPDASTGPSDPEPPAAGSSVTGSPSDRS